MSGSRSISCSRIFVLLTGCPVITILIGFSVLFPTRAGAQVCFNPAVNYAVGSSPWSVCAADLDRDGDQDLVAANSVSNNVSVLKNNGNGTFAAAVNYATGAYPMSVFAADLDGDGDLDLAVANYDGNSVSILKNNGNGTFAAAVNYAVGTQPRSVFAIDLDGDGVLDLAVANYGSGNVSVLRNNGGGTFAAAVNYATGTNCISVFAADLDGDGDPDLAAANALSGNVSILKNNGNGTFAAAVNYPAGSLPFSVFAADLDGDGDQDLALANDIAGGTVSVLKNNGNGTFAAAVAYGAGTNPVAVSAADLDGDGDQDLAVGNAGGNNVSVMTNNGNGTFAAPINYAVGTQPWSVIAADLDGDGDQELATANLNSNNVSILKNCAAAGPFRVSNLGNSGIGSLRAAIDAANASIFSNTIVFAVAGVIHLLSPLPTLTNAGTAIRGFTAPGAAPTLPPTVILDGSASTPGAAILIESSSNVVEGLTIRNFGGAGVGVKGEQSVSNTITRCLFYGNAGLGIDLGNDGITLNIYDPFMDSTGPNHRRNYPVFDSVVEPSPGTFDLFGSAVAYSHVELYLAAEAGNPAYQPEGTTHGPAYLFLEATDAGMYGDYSFSSVALPEWSRVTATATDQYGNTSEFALNRILVPSPLKITGYSEPLPPLAEVRSTAMLAASPAMQITVCSPADPLGNIDSIGPTFNTFGTRATYDSVTDVNSLGIADVRVTIVSPDTGTYTIRYKLIGDPGSYLTGIGIDGHAEAYQTVAFNSTGEVVVVTYPVAAPIRGRLNADGVINVQDLMILINIVFRGAPKPVPPELADVNCDGFYNILDVVYLVNYVFKGGQDPCQ